jgi:hypothetical protein
MAGISESAEVASGMISFSATASKVANNDQ